MVPGALWICRYWLPLMQQIIITSPEKCVWCFFSIAFREFLSCSGWGSPAHTRSQSFRYKGKLAALLGRHLGRFGVTVLSLGTQLIPKSSTRFCSYIVIAHQLLCENGFLWGVPGLVTSREENSGLASSSPTQREVSHFSHCGTETVSLHSGRLMRCSWQSSTVSTFAQWQEASVGSRSSPVVPVPALCQYLPPSVHLRRHSGRSPPLRLEVGVPCSCHQPLRNLASGWRQLWKGSPWPTQENWLAGSVAVHPKSRVQEGGTKNIPEENCVKSECAVPCVLVYKQPGRFQVSRRKVAEGLSKRILVAVWLGTGIGSTVTKATGGIWLERDCLRSVRLPDMKARPLGLSRLSSYMKRIS